VAVPIIKIDNLVKDFRSDFWKKSIRVLDGVNLEVDEGDVFGFVGPNGSGKTTTMKIMMRLVHPTSGSVKIFGKPVSDISIKKDIGFLPENPYFYEYLRAEEFLRFYAGLFGLSGKELGKRIDFLLELVGMDQYRDRQLRKFSKGMLQRIGIAQALVNDPKLVIFDEPQTGLDPIGRRDVRDILLRLKGEGKTVFFSSHIMHDVETVCEKIGIIIDGKIRDAGYINDLIAPKVLYQELIFRVDDIKSLATQGLDVRKVGSDYVVKIEKEERLAELVQAIYAKRGLVLAITPHKENLESIFIKQVGTGL
jgi:ABC-2 type transport system ATP-binding protein